MNKFEKKAMAKRAYRALVKMGVGPIQANTPTHATNTIVPDIRAYWKQHQNDPELQPARDQLNKWRNRNFNPPKQTTIPNTNTNTNTNTNIIVPDIRAYWKQHQNDPELQPARDQLNKWRNM